jgi:hypothetical protein
MSRTLIAYDKHGRAVWPGDRVTSRVGATAVFVEALAPSTPERFGMITVTTSRLAMTTKDVRGASVTRFTDFAFSLTVRDV